MDGQELARVVNGAQLKQVALLHGLGQGDDGLGLGVAARALAAAVAAAPAGHAVLQGAGGRHGAHDLASVVGAVVAHHLVAGGAHEVGIGEVAVEGALEAAVDGQVLRSVHLASGQRGVDGLAVGAHHVVDVVRGLHAALHLEGAHARVDHLLEVVDGAVVLGAERAGVARGLHHVALLVHQVVRQAAGLGAQAAVGRAPGGKRAHHTDTGVAEAQGAVAKALQLDALLGNAGDLLEGELAREGHAVGAHLAAPGRAAGVVDVGLGGDVRLNLRPRATDLAEQAPVLDDEGVRAQEPCATDQVQHARNLARGNGHVDRHVHTGAGQVRAAAGLGKGLLGEVLCAAAGVEVVAQAAVDGVRARCQGGVEGFGAAGGRQQLDDVLVGQDLLPSAQSLHNLPTIPQPGAAPPPHEPPARRTHFSAKKIGRRSFLRSAGSEICARER